MDQGTSTLTSPPLDATNYEALTLSFSRWFYAAPVTNPASDFMQVQWSRNAADWNTLEELTISEASWVSRALPLPLSAFGPGLQVRFVADDQPSVALESVVELLVDELSLAGSRIECDSFTAPLLDAPNVVGNTLLVSHDGVNVRLDWTSPAVDGTHGAATLYRMYRSADPAAGFSQDGLSTSPWHVENDEAQAPSPVYWQVVAENSGGTTNELP